MDLRVLVVFLGVAAAIVPPGPAGSATAAVLRVPSVYANIQSALDAALDGDTVLVAAGTYTGSSNRNLDFAGKRIILTSESGAGGCILDCQGEGRGIYFHGGEGETTVVEGLTIVDGWHPTSGGGILCQGASPTIRNCVIQACAARDTGGGGIHASGGANPRIVGCVIQYCSTTNGNGGGLAFDTSCQPTVDFCRISGNVCYAGQSKGGGIYCVSYGQLTLLNTVVENNAAGYGGGLYVLNHTPYTVANCLFTGNTASPYLGGGIYANSYSPASFLNCTWSGNTATDGGGIFFDSHSNITVKNSIMWGDTPQEIRHYASSLATVTYSDIQGGWTGAGNLNANPQFATGPDGSYYLSQTAAGQPSNSPCRNAGETYAADTCYPGATGPYCVDLFTTRTDELTDSGPADMGYHHIPPGYVPVPAASPAGLGLLAAVLAGLMARARRRTTSGRPAP